MCISFIVLRHVHTVHLRYWSRSHSVHSIEKDLCGVVKLATWKREVVEEEG